MRIAFVSQIVPYPPHGGVLQRGFNLLREIGRHHRVHLLAYVHPDTLHRPGDLEAGRLALSEFCDRIDYFPLWPKRSPIHKLAAFSIGAVHPKPFSVIAHRSRALSSRLREATRSGCDLVHLDTIGLAELAADCSGVPCVLTHHNIESRLMARRAQVETSRFATWYVRRQARLLEQYEHDCAPRFPLNVVVSELDGRELQALAPGAHTVVVENGVDVDYFQPRRGLEERALVYTGGMNMFANRDAVMWFLENVWPMLKQEVPDLKFFAVGQDPPETLLALRDREPGIEVPGFVDDVRPWVARAAVYVVPLRVGGGTRLKVLDAMAQGKALVSTTVGCEGIRVTPGRHLQTADSPDAMAAQILRLLANPQERFDLGDRARQLVEEQYAWPRIAAKLLDAYQEVVENGTRQASS
jgi:sugar transferase (PEP-CTERM/EpsH1 system associated)